MKLPAYPLITIDPLFSIWSQTDNLYDSDTVIWYGKTKRVSGSIIIDGKSYRFMGKGKSKPLTQTDLKVTPYITYYTFENEAISLEIRFYTPLLIKELNHLASPISYIDYIVTSKDNKQHTVEIITSLGEELCSDKGLKKANADVISYKNTEMAVMGLSNQKPLSKCGDGCTADWGYYYITGGKVNTGKGRNRVISTHTINLKKSAEASVIIGFDDVYSIEYMGDKIKGLWTEYYKDIKDCIAYYKKNKKDIYKKLLEQNDLILNDAAEYGENYQQVLTAAARQILAGHKLIRNKNGELLYLSKECYSNGSINTVDVSYPAQPFFLVYNPELIKAMMTGIFFYANSDAWRYDFAPHDIGTYPIADGQTYALKWEMLKYRRSIYKEFREYHKPEYQMPVEECGNMIIMSYAYYKMSNDISQIKENIDTLKMWADFLVGKGYILDTQLCTDDFAGHCEKNVNLAIKSIMGIACFGKICNELGLEDTYTKTAKKFAKELISITNKNKYLSFAVGMDDTWSLKYNMVWDILFDFKLFTKEIYKAESKKYVDEMNKYGTPLDYRKDFTKSDWEMWASCLDNTDKNTDLLSKTMLNYLAETKDKYPFSDWYQTKEAREMSFRHRTVQGGLWMPVLKSKLR